MNFNDLNILSNTNVCFDEINVDERITINNKYIFLANLKSSKEIIVTQPIIVLGDIECDFLNSLQKIICYGNIKINRLFSVKEVICCGEVECFEIISGSIKKKKNPLMKEKIIEVEIEKEKIVEVEKIIEKEKTIEVIKEVNPLEMKSINLNKIKENLKLVNEFKSKVKKYASEEMIFLDEDNFLKELDILGKTFLEFEDSYLFLEKMKFYSEKENIYDFREYLDFLNLIEYIPDWLDEIDLVEETIDKLLKKSAEEIYKLELDLNTKDDFVELIAQSFYNKNSLGMHYENIIEYILEEYNKKFNLENVKKKLLDEQKNSKSENSYINDIEIQSHINKLYDKYIWERRAVWEFRIKTIEEDYIELEPIENVDKYVYVFMKKQDTREYKLGEKILGLIYNLSKESGVLKIEVTSDVNNILIMIRYLCKKYNIFVLTKNISIKENEVSILLDILKNNFENNYIKNALNDIKRELESCFNRYINLLVYDNNPIKFASNIFNISENNIEIDRITKICIIKNISIYDENRINDFLRTNRRYLKEIFNYDIKIYEKPLI